jgi:hypothetical protein
MGIKQLNNFLLENCSKSAIYKIQLRNLGGKVLVIDTSIYLYKFAEKSAVAENMYLLISVFRQHNIIPVFVFDGKPPAEKKALLIKRKIEKDAAEEKYNELKMAVEEGRVSNAALTEMELLKKQFVRVTDADIVKSKEVMRAYGITYIESNGESDHLCAFLVKHGFAWACLSDDMDMFLYGCPRVIRHLSLLNHEGIYYDTSQILTDLDMTQEVFNDIAILSGTDYNVNEHKSLSDTLRYYMEYREWLHFNGDSAVKETKLPQVGSFYEWLMKTTNYIKDLTPLIHIRKMFDLNRYLSANREEFKRIVDVMPFAVGEYTIADLQTVLNDDGFIFA